MITIIEAEIEEIEFQQFTKNALQKFSPADTAIAKMHEDYLPLVIAGVDDTEGFKRVHQARMIVKNHRVQVDKVRKELKADALEYGRRVDDEAKRITLLLEPIEKHLTKEENEYTAEKERIRNEARLKAEAEERAKTEAEAARLKAIQDVENARLKAEADRLAEERRQLDEERRQIETEKKRLADIEAARLRKIEDERIAREAAEKARIETEQRIAREAAEAKFRTEMETKAAKIRAEAEEAARKRTEELRPDCEKIRMFAENVRTLPIPELSVAAENTAAEIYAIVERAARKIADIADLLSQTPKGPMKL